MPAEHAEIQIPATDLPAYLQGLQPPLTTEEVLEHAEAHGASADALAYIEALPAAVFSSEAGMRHAFASLVDHGLPHLDADHVLLGKDGTSS